MTHRRWQNGATEEAIGPQEQQVRDELRDLGWIEGTTGGKFGTLARQAINLAETHDHTNAARDLAALDNTLAKRMDEVRAEAAQVAVKATQGDEEEAASVDEFSRRRRARARRGRPDAPPAVGGDASD